MATRKRLSKALFLRICAVGLFLALGTFAVMHSIQNQNKKNADETAELDSENPDIDTANDVPVVDPDGKIKVATVSGTEPAQDGVDPASKPKNTGMPRFNPPSSSGNSFASGNQFSGSTTPPSNSNSRKIPPFNQAGNKPPTTDSKMGGTGLPPIQPTWPPSMNASNTKSGPNTTKSGPPVRPGSTSSGGFSASNPSATAGSPGNSILPPLRSTEPATKSNLSGGSSGFAANPPGSSSRSNQMVPIRPKTPSGSDSPGDEAVGPPKRSGNLAGNAALAAGAAASGFAAANLPKPPGGDSSSNPPTNTTAQQNPFGGSPQNDTPPPNRPGSAFPNPTTSNPTQVTASPTRVVPATNRSGIPANNASSSTLPPRQPQTSLSSVPMTSPGQSSISQPTPGERRLEGVQIPALAVQKIAPREIQVNREATFELIVKNTGKATADNVQVHDFVPEGTQLVETIPAARASANGQITWSLGAMAPGQQTSIKMKLLPKRAGNIGSVAHVTFGAVASAQTVCTEPKLSVRHEAPATVLLGQNVLMNIFVENTGNGAAENVVLQTDIPDGLTFASGQKELEYSIGTLPPGQTRQVQLPLRAAKVGQARNILAAHGAGSLRATDAVAVRVVAPQLNLRSEGPNRKFLNRPATHTLTLENQGSAAATNVQMVARLPRGLQFTSANNGGQYDRANHVVVWRLAKLDAQKTGKVQLTTVPVTPGQLDIGITAVADLNQRQQTTQSLVVQQLTELYFDIDDSADAIEVGTTTTYRVRIVNQGKIPANNVQAQVDFAPAIKPVSVQAGIRYQVQGQTVKLDTIPSLQPGQEISFVITANALQAGDHRTVVSVRCDDREIAVSKEESTHVYSDR